MGNNDYAKRESLNIIIKRNEDNIKRLYCKNKNIKLFEISYKDLEKVENILKNILIERNIIHDNPLPSLI